MSRKPLQRIQATLVARRYFVERQTKVQIAEELGISRFKVARLIDAAIEEELVRFVIAETGDLDIDLSERLRQKFSLKSALVLSGPDLSAAALTTPLGTIAAQLLEEILEDGQILGVACGRTLGAMARALTRLPKVDVVQVAGTLSFLEYSQNPVELVHRMASLSGGNPYPLYVPMWVDDPSLASRLNKETSVARVRALFDKLDALVVGIGSWNPPESCLCNEFPPAWLEQANAAGVCADLCATLIDRQGNTIATPLDQAGLSIRAEQLRRVPNVIGIGGGMEKAAAIEAVLRGGWIHTLVTDAGVARRLVAS